MGNRRPNIVSILVDNKFLQDRPSYTPNEEAQRDTNRVSKSSVRAIYLFFVAEKTRLFIAVFQNVVERNMNRKKLKQSLGLGNVAIFVGLLFFYPTYLNRSISYSSEFERVIKEFAVARNWSDITAILVVLLLATASLYLFITAFNDENI